MRTRRHRIFALATLALGLCALPAFACDTPVYAYAMAHWEPYPYAAILYPEQSENNGLDRLREMAGNANIAWTLAPPSPEEAPSRPWFELHYPRTAPGRPPLVAAPFSLEGLRPILESPKRREVATALLAGDAAVWVLLESGQPADEQAHKMLQTTLEGLAADHTAQPETAAYKQREAADNPFATAKFSLSRVSRDDPAERFFVDMLLGTEADLRDYKEPMAFPIYGRGRALYALVGAGINENTINEACLFLSSACSCIAKDANPGTDLLMDCDWENATLPPARLSALQNTEEATIPTPGMPPLWPVIAAALAASLLAVSLLTWRRWRIENPRS